ncbi:MAG: biotin--[acetyl-CoA-carboxylase] ligase [bacterium]
MKDIDLKLLKILKENKNEFISGEEMSSTLNVSRTTVWKHIKKLRKQGFLINSVTNKGYSLQEEPDTLIAEEIKIGLDTEEIGSDILIFDSLDSSNNKAKELARKDNYPSGTVIVAEEQTEGKGRLGRSWFSPAETGLFISIILRPQLAPTKAPFLTIVASLAVVDAINKTLSNIKSTDDNDLEIKWPNDILLNKKKISGILSEMSADMDNINYAVVGIGINVNQEIFPEEIKKIATSLKIEYGQEINRKSFLEKILKSFEKFYLLLIAGQDNLLLELWKDNLKIIDKEVIIINNKEKIKGRVINISERGELILEDEKGEIYTFWAGDVSLREEEQ